MKRQLNMMRGTRKHSILYVPSLYPFLFIGPLIKLFKCFPRCIFFLLDSYPPQRNPCKVCSDCIWLISHGSGRDTEQFQFQFHPNVHLLAEEAFGRSSASSINMNIKEDLGSQGSTNFSSIGFFSKEVCL